MKKNTLILSIVAITLLLSFKAADPTDWLMDKNHAKLGFTVTHLMISDVEGWFKSFDAKITSSGNDFSNAMVEMTGDVTSINTDNEQRDTHLKGPDFFDITKFPRITFKSKTFRKVNDNAYKVTGDLTMHGITKTVELDAVCRMGTNPNSKQTVAGFKITGMIKRSDFNIGTSTPVAMIGDEISIVANAEFIKK